MRAHHGRIGLSLCVFGVAAAVGCGSVVVSGGGGGSGTTSSSSGTGGETTSGTGGAGNGGTGGAATGGVAGGGGAPPQCEESLRRCPHEIVYGDDQAMTVEVRGDWQGAESWLNGVAMAKGADGLWHATLPVPWGMSVLYKLVIDGAIWINDPNNPLVGNDGAGNICSRLEGTTCADWTCVVVDPIWEGPWKDAVFYSIVTDRFLDGDPSNNGVTPAGVEPPAAYQGGDWAGLQQKIEEGYFTDLGVTTLVITTPVESFDGAEGVGHPSTAFLGGGWTTDGAAAESHFGSKAELVAVVNAAHAKNLTVLLGISPRLVHQTSGLLGTHPEWFAPYCFCGDPACDPNQPPNTCSWNTFQRSYNFSIPEARKHTLDLAVTWLAETGADGYAIDTLKELDPTWIKDLRQRVTAQIEPVTGQHVFLTGEMYTGDFGQLGAQVDPLTKLDGVDVMPVRAALLRTVLMRKAPMSDLDSSLTFYHQGFGDGLMRTHVGFEYTPRAIHFAEDTPLWDNEWANGGDKSWSNTPSLPGGTSAFERLRNAFTVLFTINGIPQIEYGDEWGMAGAGVPDSVRVMPWSGYTQEQLWLRDQVKGLMAMRAAHPALRRGDFTVLSGTSDTLVYRRQKDTDVVIVALNRGDAAQTAAVPPGTYVDLLSGAMVTGPSVSLSPRQGMALSPL